MAHGENAPPVFEFCDAAPAGPRRELLGLWAAAPLPAPAAGNAGPAGAVAFDLAGGPPPASDEPLWRASFPDDADQIAAFLAEARVTLWASQAALAAAPARIDAYAAQAPFVAAQARGLLYFEAPGAGPAQLESERSWGEAVRAFQSFAARVQQMAADWGRVETRVGGQLVGLSRVAWSGDLSTCLAARVDADRIRLHQQTLHLALATRQTSLRVATLIVAAAAKVALTLVTPVGVVRLAPLALRLFEQLRVEFETLEKIKKGGPS
jgi:hypothetical protein